MKTTAQVVIIGGGVAGASIAYYLAEKGMKDVLLLEKGSLASGATGNTEGFVRMHHTNPWQAAMALRSWEVYRNWGDIIGGYCGFRKTGYLLLVGHRDIDHLQANVKMLKEIGVNTEAISTDDVRSLQPFLNTGDVGAAAYEPESGYADGSLTVNSFIERAREMGVRVKQDAPVMGIKVKNGRVQGVVLDGQEVHAPIVVLAAGAWSATLALTAEVDIPVESRRVAAGILKRPSEIKDHMIVMDFAQSRTAFRPEGRDLTTTTIREVPKRQYPLVDPDNFDHHIGNEDLILTGSRLSYRFPIMADAGWVRTLASVDSFTPDGHAILDKTPGVDGLYVAAGFSGGGFKIGPALGMCMAELIIDGRASTADIVPFRLSRFEEGKPIISEHEYSNDTARQVLSMGGK